MTEQQTETCTAGVQLCHCTGCVERRQTVPCQLCGDHVLKTEIRLHLARHATGEIAKRSVAETFARGTTQPDRSQLDPAREQILDALTLPRKAKCPICAADGVLDRADLGMFQYTCGACRWHFSAPSISALLTEASSKNYDGLSGQLPAMASGRVARRAVELSAQLSAQNAISLLRKGICPVCANLITSIFLAADGKISWSCSEGCEP